MSTVRLTGEEKDVDFKTATDRLLAGGITLDQIADACGVSKNLVARARMEGEGSRNPPAGWETALGDLARERSAEFGDLAAQLK